MPTLLSYFIIYLDDPEVLELEGIFRKQGNIADANRFMKAINERKENDDVGIYFAELNQHTIANLMKKYLRNMEPPLFPYEIYYDITNKDFSKLGDAMKMKFVKQIVRALPDINYATLFKLLEFLYKVTQHGGNNKMNAFNIATVFTPNIIREKDLPPLPGEIAALITQVNQDQGAAEEESAQTRAQRLLPRLIASKGKWGKSRPFSAGVGKTAMKMGQGSGAPAMAAEVEAAMARLKAAKEALSAPPNTAKRAPGSESTPVGTDVKPPPLSDSTEPHPPASQVPPKIDPMTPMIAFLIENYETVFAIKEAGST